MSFKLNESVFLLTEFDERIVKASLNWGYLVVITSTKCFIYRLIFWGCRDTVAMIMYRVNF